MKIVNIVGSPRKNGTSARIARTFTETATTLGATVTEYYLNGMHTGDVRGAGGAHHDVLERYSMYLELYGFDVRIITAAGLRIQPNTDVGAHLNDAAVLARELLQAS